MQLAGLVLAAGGARRFGSPKVLAPFHGEPLVRRAARLLSPLCPAGVFVVTGDGEAAIRTALTGTGADCVPNPDWSDGLSSSLRAGVAALPAAAEAVLIQLADTPAVTDRDLDTLVAAWQVEPQLPAAAHYGDRAGPPVILPRSLLPELAALRGDQGARSLLQWHTELITVPMPHAALDVDTPADLAQLEARPAQ
ncbi:MAG: nucleotidyltransferase family protein [Gammaproteobacteria bacterium]|nr:nucleotidyltransferase family protein [Gammaproteobacteria bacterium]